MPGSTTNHQIEPNDVSLRIEGMTCGSCVARVESALKAVSGVESARVNLATETASVRVTENGDAQRLVRAVQAAGYDAVPIQTARAADVGGQRRQEQRLREQRQALVVAAGIGLPILGLHWVASILSGTHVGAHFWPTAMQGLLMVMLLISPAGGPILVSGLRAAWHRSPNMDLLIALGVLAATLGTIITLFVPALPQVNYFHDAALILMFINLGKYLEARARNRASSSLSALVQRAPRRAVRLENGQPKEVPVEQVRPGDVLQVGAENFVPVDGRVQSGKASVDAGMWTGESVPVEVEPGDEVLGGTYVQAGAITMQATAVGSASAISRIIEMVERAQSSTTRMQRVADRVAGMFVPFVVVLALLTAAGWLIWGGQSAGPTALTTMIAVLVVSCPCAMGLATPTAVTVATGSAALKGIIVRDAAVLEYAADCDVILLDKTGTITTGKPQVAQIKTGPGFDENRVLQLAASAEQFSPHPLAKAIVQAARDRRLDLIEPSDYAAEAGLGVKATINGEPIFVGSEKYLVTKGIPEAPGRPAWGFASINNGTFVYVAANGTTVGAIVLRDAIRDGAADVVARLQEMGLHPVLVTGDRTAVAQAVAKQVGIDEVHAEISPQGKSELAQKLRSEGRRVIMVGDGINDAPALAAADVGIAMAGGTQVAAETSGITLVGDRIELLVSVVELARRSLRIIHQNLFWAFGYNVIAIPLAAFAVLPASYAAAAMMFSSISVVLNSLRLQR